MQFLLPALFAPAACSLLGVGARRGTRSGPEFRRNTKNARLGRSVAAQVGCGATAAAFPAYHPLAVVCVAARGGRRRGAAARGAFRGGAREGSRTRAPSTLFGAKAPSGVDLPRAGRDGRVSARVRRRGVRRGRREKDGRAPAARVRRGRAETRRRRFSDIILSGRRRRGRRFPSRPRGVGARRRRESPRSPPSDVRSRSLDQRLRYAGLPAGAWMILGNCCVYAVTSRLDKAAVLAAGKTLRVDRAEKSLSVLSASR